jgi:hypothetical protein
MKTRSGYTSILTAFALSGAVLVSGCTPSGQGYTDEAPKSPNAPTRTSRLDKEDASPYSTKSSPKLRRAMLWTP